MKRIFYFILFCLIVINVQAADYYFKNPGGGGTACNIGSPCDDFNLVQSKYNQHGSGEVVNIWLGRGSTFTIGETTRMSFSSAQVHFNSYDANAGSARPIIDGGVQLNDWTSKPPPCTFYNLINCPATMNCCPSPSHEYWYALFYMSVSGSSFKNIEVKNYYSDIIQFCGTAGLFSGNYFHNYGSQAVGDGTCNVNDTIVEYNVTHDGQKIYEYFNHLGEFWGGAIGFHSEGKDDFWDNTIRYNLIYDIFGEGIFGNGSIVEYNVIGDTGSSAIHGTVGEENAHDMTIRYNFIVRSSNTYYNGLPGSGPDGIILYDEQSTTDVYQTCSGLSGCGDNSGGVWEVYGNVIINREIGIRAYKLDNLASARIYNNTIIDSSTSNIVLGEDSDQVGASYIRNNASISYSVTPTYGQLALSPPTGYPGVWTITNNSFWGPGGTGGSNTITGNPLLAGQGSTDWSPGGVGYYNAIEISDVAPTSGSALFNSGAGLTGLERTFLNNYSDFTNITTAPVIATSENNAPEDIGAIMFATGGPTNPVVNITSSCGGSQATSGYIITGTATADSGSTITAVTETSKSITCTANDGTFNEQVEAFTCVITLSVGVNNLIAQAIDNLELIGTDNCEVTYTIPGDTTPPTFQSATIPTTGSTIIIDFDESVTESGTGSNWSLTMSGGAVLLSSPSVSSDQITYTLSRLIFSGETVTSGLNYTQPGNGVEDLAGNDFASVSGRTVVNNSTVTTVGTGLPFYDGFETGDFSAWSHGTSGAIDTTNTDCAVGNHCARAVLTEFTTSPVYAFHMFGPPAAYANSVDEITLKLYNKFDSYIWPSYVQKVAEVITFDRTEDPLEKLPVLFIHGLNGWPGNWDSMIAYLKTQGYTDDLLYTIAMVDNSTLCSLNHMPQIEARIAEIMTLTGASKVDVVGHSRGGKNICQLMWYGSGVSTVRNAVTMGGANHYCPGLYGPWPEDETPGTTEYTSIYSLTDALVPPAIAIIPGADNIEYADKPHLGMPADIDFQMDTLSALQGSGLNDGLPVEGTGGEWTYSDVVAIGIVGVDGGAREGEYTVFKNSDFLLNFQTDTPYEMAEFEQWKYLVLHLKLNTPGSANGIVELWVDGALKYASTSETIVTNDVQVLGGVYINSFAWEQSGSNSYQYHDEVSLEIGDTYDPDQPAVDTAPQGSGIGGSGVSFN